MKRILSLGVFSLLIVVLNVPVFAMTTVSFQDGVSPDATYSGTEDSYGRSTSPSTNFGSEVILLSDGVTQDPDTGIYGEAMTILKWDISSILATATVTNVSITFDYTNASSGLYHLYQQNSSWSEGTVTWNDINPAEFVLGTVAPFSFGVVTLDLNSDGVALVQGWIDGSIPNYGFVIQSNGTNNSIQMGSSESAGFHPLLEITLMEGTPTLEELFSMIQDLQGQVAILNQFKADLTGVKRVGDTIQFEGVNLQIVNGLGATDGDKSSIGGLEVNGLGNLIVGYDEPLNPDFFSEPKPVPDKSGSHNIIVGKGHNYSSYGGLVAGEYNVISAKYATVLGGSLNQSIEELASISGGLWNIASGGYSHISAGVSNIASATGSSVTGGSSNTAAGGNSTVSGGTRNHATNTESTISGGSRNTANGRQSSILGGSLNITTGSNSSILGGSTNETIGSSSTVSGGSNNKAQGGGSSVSGGFANNAMGPASSVSGGSENSANGNRSTVSGGANRTAANDNEWVAGSLSEPN